MDPVPLKTQLAALIALVNEIRWMREDIQSHQDTTRAVAHSIDRLTKAIEAMAKREPTP